MAKTTLDEVRLYEEDGQYYISAKYTYEDDSVIKEIIVPKIVIPFCHDEVYGIHIEKEYPEPRFIRTRPEWYINTGLGKLKLEKGSLPGYGCPNIYSEKIIERKTHDMTIEEIEKILGRKIRVVGDKND